MARKTSTSIKDRSAGWRENAYQISVYSERLAVAYAQIQALTLEDLYQILADPALNVEYKKHCSLWRRVQATLDCVPRGATQEQQRFALASLRVLVG